MSMSYDDGQLWVGDKGGSVHLLDASSGDLRLVKVNGHIVRRADWFYEFPVMSF